MTIVRNLAKCIHYSSFWIIKIWLIHIQYNPFIHFHRPCFHLCEKKTISLWNFCSFHSKLNTGFYCKIESHWCIFGILRLNILNRNMFTRSIIIMIWYLKIKLIQNTQMRCQPQLMLKPTKSQLELSQNDNHETDSKLIRESSFLNIKLPDLKHVSHCIRFRNDAKLSLRRGLVQFTTSFFYYQIIWNPIKQVWTYGQIAA